MTITHTRRKEMRRTHMMLRRTQVCLAGVCVRQGCVCVCVRNSPVNDVVLVQELEAQQDAGRVKSENKDGKMRLSWRRWSPVGRSGGDADRACFSVKMLVWMWVIRSPPGE